MNRLNNIILLVVFICMHAHSQQAYFVDGYHGGIYGHYPVKEKSASDRSQNLIQQITR